MGFLQLLANVYGAPLALSPTSIDKAIGLEVLTRLGRDDPNEKTVRAAAYVVSELAKAGDTQKLDGVIIGGQFDNTTHVVANIGPSKDQEPGELRREIAERVLLDLREHLKRNPRDVGNAI